MVKLKELHCRDCIALTSIPELPKLEYLDCIYCKSITTISIMAKLKTLYCKYCTALTTISLFPKLEYIDCAGCTSLTTISLLPRLQILFCEDCTALTDVPWLESLYCRGCKWIDYRNVEFDSNIRALRICQAIFRRKLIAKKLVRIIPVITEIYYSPGCKGEALALHAFSMRIRGTKYIN